MAGRPLAPCGSFTAYKRHKRRGEPVDEACAQAARDQANERAHRRVAEVAEVVRLSIAENESADHAEPVDELAEARENLSIVKATMRAGVPTGMAALSKQYAELVSLVKRLESASNPKESRLDELARRRADRIAGSAN